MITSNFLKSALIIGVLIATTACANTIRGIGRDTANTVNATQSAASNVVKAAE